MTPLFLILICAHHDRGSNHVTPLSNLDRGGAASLRMDALGGTKGFRSSTTNATRPVIGGAGNFEKRDRNGISAQCPATE